jgi:hypothetical protein
MIKPSISFPLKSLQRLIILLIFIASFYPLNYEEIGINYFFLLVPLFHIFLEKKIYSIPLFLKIFILYLFIIFFVFIFLRIILNEDKIIYKQILSFFSFISAFSFIFYKFSEKSLYMFQLSIIIATLLISFNLIIDFFLLYPEKLPRDGGQRVSFILVFTILFLMFDKSVIQNQITKFLIIFILSLSVILLQSRAAYLSFFLTMLLSLILKDLRINIKFIIILLLIGFIFYKNDNLYYIYLSNFFIDLVSLNFFVIQNDSSSEVIRFERFLYLLNSEKIFLSNGFLGIWNLDEDYGSTHSQYLDVLLRVGIIGFAFYIFIIFSILSFLKKNNKGYFYAFLSILFFSFFHETFKEPQGAFILSFLFGYMIYKKRNIKTNFKKNG